jgi:hypothetical protein
MYAVKQSQHQTDFQINVEIAPCRAFALGAQAAVAKKKNNMSLRTVISRTYV